MQVKASVGLTCVELDISAGAESVSSVNAVECRAVARVEDASVLQQVALHHHHLSRGVGRAVAAPLVVDVGVAVGGAINVVALVHRQRTAVVLGVHFDFGWVVWNRM